MVAHVWPASLGSVEQAPPAAAVGSGRPERATAVPWRASASRRRPPLLGRCWGCWQGRSPAAAVAGRLPAGGVVG